MEGKRGAGLKRHLHQAVRGQDRQRAVLTDDLYHIVAFAGGEVFDATPDGRFDGALQPARAKAGIQRAQLPGELRGELLQRILLQRGQRIALFDPVSGLDEDFFYFDALRQEDVQRIRALQPAVAGNGRLHVAAGDGAGFRQAFFRRPAAGGEERGADQRDGQDANPEDQRPAAPGLFPCVHTTDLLSFPRSGLS